MQCILAPRLISSATTCPCRPPRRLLRLGPLSPHATAGRPSSALRSCYCRLVVVLSTTRGLGDTCVHQCIHRLLGREARAAERDDTDVTSYWCCSLAPLTAWLSSWLLYTLASATVLRHLMMDWQASLRNICKQPQTSPKLSLTAWV